MEQVKKIQANGHLAKWLKEFNELPCDEKIRRISDTRVKMEKEVWLDKACEWLEKWEARRFIEQFRKAMEE